MNDSDLLQSLPDAFFIVGMNGTIREYLGGASDDEVLQPAALEGKLVKDAWPAAASSAVMRNIRRVVKTRSSHNITIDLGCESQLKPYEIRLQAKGRDSALMIIRDMADQAAPISGEPARNSSDTLTGLTVRRVFMRIFEAAIADASLRERGIAVMCIDIDRFTQINASLGRSVGDAVLKVTAKRIERCLRDYDQIARIDDGDNTSLTRISGDEFVLLLSEIESSTLR